ncbi:STM3941 family protein [Epilithonimonas vandammei]|uniref:STM3941 family protein n=1 Tax=Epilithonimonas vandammei TaxID=2487072 RepID=UPI00289AB5E9|nr:STM3941 family protein [Epilithonimonas vandammei]
MKSKINKKDILIYIIFLLFTSMSIYSLVNGGGDSERKFIINLGTLIFFGGGGIVYFFLKNNFGSEKLIDDKTKIIYESKQKAFFSFLGSLVFVIMGIIMIIYNSYFVGRRMNPQIAFFIGIICVSFFGLILLVSIKRLINAKRILIEITELTLNIQIGFLKNEIAKIPKNEIVSIKEHIVPPNNFVLIFVKDPEKYIRKGFLKNTNYKITGTPININPITTNFSSNEILKFLNENINI